MISKMPNATADWLPAGFRLERRLGTGGMGEVWLATALTTGTRVAVKRLKLQAGAEGGDEADRLRFKREFLILSRMRAEGIVRAYEQGEYGDGLYYTMEHVEGWLLSDFFTGGHWRDQNASPTPVYWTDPAALAKIWKIGGEILRALAHLHAQSLVHRDLKPANIMVTGGGGVKLIDFGLARAQIADLGITRAGEVLGTPYYLSPEQIRAQPLDGRADLYAFGVILYELATGRQPFQSVSLPEVILAHLQRAPVPPRESNPAISPAHSALIMKLLSKEPAGRHASAQEALRALDACADEAVSGALMTVTVAASLNEALPAAGGILVAPYIGNGGVRESVLKCCRELLQGTGALVLLSGAPGGGKSRLGDEVRAFAADQGLKILQATCQQGSGVAGQLFHDLFAQIADYLSRRPEIVSVWRGEDAAVLARHFPAMSRLPAPDAKTPLTPLEPEAEKARLFAAVYQCFAQLAGKLALVLWLEDLHWADELSLALTGHLIHSFATGAASGQPQLLVIGNYRSDEVKPEGSIGQWLASQRGGRVFSLKLAPLTETELTRLVESLLGLNEPPPVSFVRRLFELTGGNPYFATETVKGLVMGGQLQPNAGAGWNFTHWTEGHGQSGSVNLPETVQAVLERRLAQVNKEVREALKAAAVIGRRFQFGWWLGITGLGENQLLEIAEQAIQAELLLDAGQETLRFSHDQLRAALLLGLSSLNRRRLHGKIVAAIAGAGKTAEHLELLADHAVEAGLQDEAVRYGHPAVVKLNRACQYQDAIALLARIEALYGAESPMTPGVLLTHQHQLLFALIQRGENQTPLALLPETLALARQLADTVVEQDLRQMESTCHLRSGDYEKGIAAAESALALARARQDPGGEAKALRGIGTGLMNQGEMAAALEKFMASLAIARAAGDLVESGRILKGLGILNYFSGDLDQAEKYDRESLTVGEQTGDQEFTAIAAGHLGENLMYHGHLPEAEAALHRALRLNQEMGKRDFVCDNLNNLGQCHTHRGNPVQAEKVLRDSVRQAEALGDRYFEMDGRIYLARALAHQERLVEAADEIAAAVRVALEIGNRPKLAKARSVMAQIALWAGDLPLAIEAANEALEVSAGKFKESEARALVVRTAARCQAGEPFDEAAIALACRLAAESRSFELDLLVCLYHARALLDAGRGAEVESVLVTARDRGRKAGFVAFTEYADALLVRARGAIMKKRTDEIQ